MKNVAASLIKGLRKISLRGVVASVDRRYGFLKPLKSFLEGKMSGVMNFPEHVLPCHRCVARMRCCLNGDEEDVTFYSFLRDSTKCTAKSGEDDEVIASKVTMAECRNHCAPPTLTYER